MTQLYMGLSAHIRRSEHVAEKSVGEVPDALDRVCQLLHQLSSDIYLDKDSRVISVTVRDPRGESLGYFLSDPFPRGVIEEFERRAGARPTTPEVALKILDKTRGEFCLSRSRQIDFGSFQPSEALSDIVKNLGLRNCTVKVEWPNFSDFLADGRCGPAISCFRNNEKPAHELRISFLYDWSNGTRALVELVHHDEESGPSLVPGTRFALRKEQNQSASVLIGEARRVIDLFDRNGPTALSEERSRLSRAITSASTIDGTEFSRRSPARSTRLNRLPTYTDSQATVQCGSKNDRLKLVVTPGGGSNQAMIFSSEVCSREEQLRLKGQLEFSAATFLSGSVTQRELLFESLDVSFPNFSVRDEAFGPIAQCFELVDEDPIDGVDPMSIPRDADSFVSMLQGFEVYAFGKSVPRRSADGKCWTRLTIKTAEFLVVELLEQDSGAVVRATFPQAVDLAYNDLPAIAFSILECFGHDSAPWPGKVYGRLLDEVHEAGGRISHPDIDDVRLAPVTVRTEVLLTQLEMYGGLERRPFEINGAGNAVVNLRKCTGNSTSLIVDATGPLELQIVLHRPRGGDKILRYTIPPRYRADDSHFEGFVKALTALVHALPGRPLKSAELLRNDPFVDLEGLFGEPF